MKIAKFTVVTLFATLIMSGCSEAKLNFGDENSATISDKGILSIESLVVDCRVDESAPEVGIMSARSTRGSVVVDDLLC